MRTQIGRPIDPTSASQRTPWMAYGKSRAWYYWRKRYGDLPEPKYPFWDAPDIGVEQPEPQWEWEAYEIGLSPPWEL